MNSLPLPENPDAPDSAAAASRPALHPNTIAFGVLSVALILLASAQRFSPLFSPIEDPDLFWHIVIGRWILDHGAVPQVEHWNYFGLGQTFRAYSWSSEVIYALVDRHVGLRGLWWLQGLSALGLIAVATFVFRHFSRSWLLTLLAGVLFLVFIDPFTSIRPQLITFILFALIPLIAESIQKNGLKLRYGIFIFLIFLIWSNTHLAMIVGMGYLGGLLFGFSKPRVQATAWALAIAFLGTLVNPYGLGVWQTFFSKIGHVGLFRGDIAEFQPMTIVFRLFGYYAICAILFVVVALKNKKIARFEIAVTAAFFLLGAYAIKFLPFTALASLTFILKNGADLVEDELVPILQKKLGRAVDRWNNIFASRFGLGALVSLSVLCVVLLAARLIEQAREPFLLEVFPDATLDFIFKNQLPKPILSDFRTGGYLMYRLSDARGHLLHPVAIDGRTNILSPAHTLAYYSMYHGWAGWKAFIERYQPGTIVWPVDGDSPLSRLLIEGDEWCQVFDGNQTVEGYSVFTRCAADK